ncbi:hypothetical protein IFM89_004267 [Coptis chinensis]|uniref:RING-type E3 ubiquitin transferase n=1 Tax=Coptis chinensis TaxID=261450 RepID=A0A835I9W7_9MAGN|nr:hypothetical protein IFM89_004267 [Coptis chinensis]
MVKEEENKTPKNTKNPTKPSLPDENGDTMFSPRFKSVAAMAGWDEEALLLATLVVEDTPDREPKHKKRINTQFKSPPQISSTRRTRVQIRNSSAASVPIVVLDLDDDKVVADEETEEKKNGTNTNDIKEQVVKTSREEDCNTKRIECNTDGIKESVVEGGGDLNGQNSSISLKGSALPCMNRLREELSCAICLDICFEPSTTSCGHSFCKKCLKSAADKCGKKCPKCRQLISNGRSCTVNTVLWNTIQLLFPQEVESRKAAEATKGSELACRNPEKEIIDRRNQSTRVTAITSRDVTSGRRRRGVSSQDEDAVLALRLQREEYLQVARGSQEQGRGSFVSAGEILGRASFSSVQENLGRASFSSARENLRAMASRAVNLRVRRG